MSNQYAAVTEETGFFQGTKPETLAGEFGTPLYVYSEKILRLRCREMSGLIDYPRFSVNYSAKANCNLSLLKIIREEGLKVDAMSPGEIHVEMLAGFKPEEILYIGNNVSADEIRFAVDRNITVSVDSLSQLELFGSINTKGSVAVRFNPGVGAGHHEKVVTAGRKTKFGIDPSLVFDVKKILEKHGLTLTGINQHIGSLFMEGNSYIEGTRSLLEIAKHFPGLDFIDLGGGFGVPYRKREGEKRLDLSLLGERLESVIHDFIKSYGREITVKIEPGRYVAAESGLLLGTVHAVKYNYGTRYIGTDIGFNVLKRPVLYGSHHDIEIYPVTGGRETAPAPAVVVGNICETGDIIAENIELPEVREEDLIGVLDAGAYGYVMSSNYNNRLRPAEVLLEENGGVRLIRKRETLEDLARHFPGDVITP